MIVARVRRTLTERGMLEPGMRVVVGCSGGPDSAALLSALAELGEELRLDLRVASVDHGLRQDAALDVALARAQAEAVGVAFTALKVEVEAGPSLQAQARSVRYGALLRLAAELGAQRVAVGHTLDDQAETVLMRLLRGASVAGLSGVQPAREDGVIRPLIDCSRAEAHAFAAARFAGLAADPSNQNARFLRVRVRHGLLQALREEDPAIDSHLAALADDARQVRAHLDGCATALLSKAASDGGTVSIHVLASADGPTRRAALRAWAAGITGRDPGRSQQLELERLLRGRGEVMLGAGFVARVGDGRLRIDAVSAPDGLPDGGLDAGHAGAKVVKE